MGWFQDRWQDLMSGGSGTWLAIAVWVAVLLGVAALIYAHRQIKQGRELRLEETRPHVAMFMEPHASDWHLIELVVRNFGETSAYDVQFTFINPPTVAQYEGESSGRVHIAELSLPDIIPVLAPGQEWRTVWDSAPSRAQLGSSIDWRFTGTVKYFDAAAPEDTGKRGKRSGRKRHDFQTKVILDWEDLQPVQRVELMTGHDLAQRDKQKLELLRNLLTYFHYASLETRADVYRSEIDGVRRATEAVKERLRSKQLEDPTDVVQIRPLNIDAQYQPNGRHHDQPVSH
ncbi:MAG: hypothetical protein QOH57_2978 [Mycobacterium sp.]|nr:hypothetical protein [Mycobacterium sp.]